MKADLFVQGNYWASFDIPGDSLLALLAAGITATAEKTALRLQSEVGDLGHVECSVNIRWHHPTTYNTDEEP